MRSYQDETVLFDDREEFWEQCDYCDRRSADVETVIDPYLEELYGEEEYITVCEECLDNRRDDI